MEENQEGAAVLFMKCNSQMIEAKRMSSAWPRA